MKIYNGCINLDDRYSIVVDQTGKHDFTAISVIKHTKYAKKVLETKIINPREDIEEHIKSFGEFINKNNNKLVSCVSLYDEFIKINK